MQGENEFRCGPRLALRPRGDRQHALDRFRDSRDGLAGAARLLDRHRLESIGLRKPVFLLHAADLKHLAAEPDHHDAGEVRMARIAPLRPPQHVEPLTIGSMAASGAVHDGDDAVDVRIIRKHARSLEFRGREAGNGGGAIHRGENAEIVARSCLAGVARIAFEGGTHLRRQKVVVLRLLAEAVVALEIMHADIVFVHPFARRDVRFRKTDDLPELAHRLALADRLGGHLVAAQNPLARREPAGEIPLLDEIDGDNDVVVAVQANGAWCVHGSTVRGGQLSPPSM